MLMARGLQASGWEELGSRRVKMHGADKLIPNPVFANRNFRVYVWADLWGAEDLGYRLANAGYKTILAPVSAFYFDMAYNQNPDEPGAKWAPFTDIDAAYDFVPYDFVRRVPTDPAPVPGRDGLSDVGRGNIVGLEGELWSETMRELPQIDYLLMPRLVGLAERAWAPDPDWAQAVDAATAARVHATAWSTFMNQLGRQVLPRIDAEPDGIRYRIPPPGLRRVDGRVEANLQLPGFTLRYTTDGSTPSVASPPVAGSIGERALIRVAAFARNGRAGQTSQIDNR
jgi:hexosaminidase